MITEQFIAQIPSNLNFGTKFILDALLKFHQQARAGGQDHDGYVEYYTLLEAYLMSHKYDFVKIEFDSDKAKNIQKILNSYSALTAEFEKKRTNAFVNDSREKFNLLFNNTFSYEFSEGDLDKVQTLINELREIISKSELFTADHKQRILNRLEKLQSELHKKVSDLDKFWGLIGDAGIAIGKFGHDAKPIVDRIKEIANIVWRTQARTEELPSGSTIPFLTTSISDDSSKENLA
jgi:hypothetical protein